MQQTATNFYYPSSGKALYDEDKERLGRILES